MDMISGSLFCQCLLRLWGAIWGAYDRSALARAVRRVAECWKRLWHGSALAHFFFEKDGAFFTAWPGSLSCRLLTAVINLPAELLHWCYGKLRPVFEGSFFANLAYDMGEQVPAAAGWLMLAIMSIHYDYWNNAYALAGFLLLFLLTVAGGMRRRSLRLDAADLGPYVICFFFAVVLAWPLSMYPWLSFRYLYYYLTCVLCLFVVVGTVETREQLERLAGFGCMGMAVASVYAVCQRIQGVEVNKSYVDLTLNADMPGRVYSFYQNPNAFAQMLVFMIPIAMALVFGAKRTRYRLVGLVSGGLGIVALIMTYSRSSWIGLVAAALVFVFLWNRRLLPACIVVGVAAIPFLPATILNRLLTIFNSSDTSTSSRVPLWQAAIQTIQTYPALGAGLGGDAVRRLVKDLGAYHGVAPFTHSHNIVLQTWLENGLLGMVAFMAGAYHVVKRGAKATFSCGDQTVRLMAAGGASAVVGAVVCGMADYIFNYPRVMLIFWFVVSLLLAAVKLSRQKVEV